MESLETKDENDISKEIKGWVLNKSVGESVLHKASRLDYVVSISYIYSHINIKNDYHAYFHHFSLGRCCILLGSTEYESRSKG
jgi:hypothetical protein